MANHAGRVNAPPPLPPPAPSPLALKIASITEAITILPVNEHKWEVLALSIQLGQIVSVRLVERTAHRDLAQDAARREVLRLAGTNR